MNQINQINQINQMSKDDPTMLEKVFQKMCSWLHFPKTDKGIVDVLINNSRLQTNIVSPSYSLLGFVAFVYLYKDTLAHKFDADPTKFLDAYPSAFWENAGFRMFRFDNRLAVHHLLANQEKKMDRFALLPVLDKVISLLPKKKMDQLYARIHKDCQLPTNEEAQQLEFFAHQEYLDCLRDFEAGGGGMGTPEKPKELPRSVFKAWLVRVCGHVPSVATPEMWKAYLYPNYAEDVARVASFRKRSLDVMRVGRGIHAKLVETNQYDPEYCTHPNADARGGRHNLIGPTCRDCGLWVGNALQWNPYEKKCRLAEVSESGPPVSTLYSHMKHYRKVRSPSGFRRRTSEFAVNPSGTVIPVQTLADTRTVDSNQKAVHHHYGEFKKALETFSMPVLDRADRVIRTKLEPEFQNLLLYVWHMAVHGKHAPSPKMNTKIVLYTYMIWKLFRPIHDHYFDFGVKYFPVHYLMLNDRTFFYPSKLVKMDYDIKATEYFTSPELRSMMAPTPPTPVKFHTPTQVYDIDPKTMVAAPTLPDELAHVTFAMRLAFREFDPEIEVNVVYNGKKAVYLNKGDPKTKPMRFLLPRYDMALAQGLADEESKHPKHPKHPEDARTSSLFARVIRVEFSKYYAPLTLNMEYGKEYSTIKLKRLKNNKRNNREEFQKLYPGKSWNKQNAIKYVGPHARFIGKVGPLRLSVRTQQQPFNVYAIKTRFSPNKDTAAVEEEVEVEYTEEIQDEETYDPDAMEDLSDFM